MARLNVNPTRMNLTTLKKRLVTAKRGHKLMKDKRDSLMKGFLELARENKRLREEVEAELAKVHESFSIASAVMSQEVLEEAIPEETELLFIENVGNLVCPAEFDTGAVKNMTVLSVPEGHDKPLKYPLMYESCQLLVINKIDVLPYFDFDCEKVVQYAKMRNPDIEVIFVSAKTGQGVDQVADWIFRNAAAWNA